MFFKANFFSSKVVIFLYCEGGLETANLFEVLCEYSRHLMHRMFLSSRIFKPASRVYASGAQRRARLTKMPENTTCKHSAQQTTDNLSVLSPRCNGWVNHPKTARFEGG